MLDTTRKVYYFLYHLRWCLDPEYRSKSHRLLQQPDMRTLTHSLLAMGVIFTWRGGSELCRCWRLRSCVEGLTKSMLFLFNYWAPSKTKNVDIPGRGKALSTTTTTNTAITMTQPINLLDFGYSYAQRDTVVGHWAGMSCWGPTRRNRYLPTRGAYTAKSSKHVADSRHLSSKY